MLMTTALTKSEAQQMASAQPQILTQTSQHGLALLFQPTGRSPPTQTPPPGSVCARMTRGSTAFCHGMGLDHGSRDLST